MKGASKSGGGMHAPQTLPVDDWRQRFLGGSDSESESVSDTTPSSNAATFHAVSLLRSDQTSSPPALHHGISCMVKSGMHMVGTSIGYASVN